MMGKIFSPFAKLLRAKNGKAKTAPSLRRQLQKLLEGPYDTHTDFTIEELHMLRNLLQFGKLQVQHVMIPRADIDAIEVSSSLKKAIAAFAKASHSRMPVYRDTLDNPLGQVHVKDMMRVLAKPPAQQMPLSKIRRKVLFAPPSMPALDLLIQMRSLRVHLALVVDEYGGTDGLVSIEDLVEGVIGQIEDEHDTPSIQTLRKLKNGQLEASARISVKAMSSILSPLIKREGWEDVDTLGGVVFRLAGRVPQRGEIITDKKSGMEFEICDVDARRIKVIRINMNVPKAQIPKASAPAPKKPVPKTPRVKKKRIVKKNHAVKNKK